MCTNTSTLLVHFIMWHISSERWTDPTQLNLTRWTSTASSTHRPRGIKNTNVEKSFGRSKLSRDRRWHEGARVWIFRLAKAHNKTMLSQPQIKTCRMQRPVLFKGHIMSLRSDQIRSDYRIISLMFWRTVILIWFTGRTLRERVHPKTKLLLSLNTHLILF